MAGSGFLTRLAAFLFFIQAATVGLVYFLRLDGPISNIPAVRKKMEEVRAGFNIDAAWTKFSGDQRVWGYVDRHSISPGESFNLMLSTKPGQPDLVGLVQISRLAWKDGELRREFVWEGEKEPIVAQNISNTAASLGADWNVNYVVNDTGQWRPGIYAVDVTTADGHEEDFVATFIVRSTKRTGDVLAKLSTNTWQAYNRWGGHSLYNSALFDDRGAMVSFDRPTFAGIEDGEIYFVTWMEKFAAESGLEVSWIGDFDLHEDPGLMDGFKLFVSQGHDEYWTREMFDAVENRVFKQGKNTVFLGANTAYWQVRYLDVNNPPGGRSRGRQMASYKDREDPMLARFSDEKQGLPFVTQQFRWKNRRPETMLAGVAYQNYFNPSDNGPFFDYRVADADLPFFEGTGWKKGDTIRGIVGYEWDNRDPEGDGKRLWAAGASANALLPLDRLRVLFTGEPVDVDGKKGLAEAVYWESPAGAKVFSSGSIRWDWGLAKPGFANPAFQRFNRNLFAWMLK